MICACQMMATDSKPIRNTQNASATLVCDSAAGRRRARTNQDIKDLLVPLVLRSFVHAAKLSVRTSTLEQSQFHRAAIEQGPQFIGEIQHFLALRQIAGSLYWNLYSGPEVTEFPF